MSKVTADAIVDLSSHSLSGRARSSMGNHRAELRTNPLQNTLQYRWACRSSRQRPYHISSGSIQFGPRSLPPLLFFQYLPSFYVSLEDGKRGGESGRDGKSPPPGCQDAYSVHSLIMYWRLYAVFGAITGSSSGSDPYISKAAIASFLCRSRSTGGRRRRLRKPHPGSLRSRGLEGTVGGGDGGGRVAAVAARARPSINARRTEGAATEANARWRGALDERPAGDLTEEDSYVKRQASKGEERVIGDNFDRRTKEREGIGKRRAARGRVDQRKDTSWRESK